MMPGSGHTHFLDKKEVARSANKFTRFESTFKRSAIKPTVVSVMDFYRHTELLEGIVNQLIDEEAAGVCFEMHRAIKLGYYELLYPEDR